MSLHVNIVLARYRRSRSQLLHKIAVLKDFAKFRQKLVPGTLFNKNGGFQGAT